jgi:membrane protease YdiL (CAAX protease family)
MDVTAAALTLAYNVAINRLVPRRWYVPANIAATATSVALARRAGASWRDLGLAPDAWRRGIRFGRRTAAPVVAGVALATAMPATRRFFVEEGSRDETPRRLLYETLLRIPFGTAVAEEVIFRGVLLGLFGRRQGWRRAALWSSALFGAWHVLPTLDSTLRRNPATEALIGPGWRSTVGALAGIALVTGAAGAGFSWLRLRSGSVLAPAIVHAALNDAGDVAAAVISRRALR